MKTITKDRIFKLDQRVGEVCKAKYNEVMEEYRKNRSRIKCLKSKKDRKMEIIKCFKAITIAACTTPESSRIVCEQNGPPPNICMFKQEIKKIEKMRKDCKMPKPKNKFGRCAEQRVANTLIQSFPSKVSLDDIFFSVALRPRTSQVVEYCENCCYLFKTLRT